MKYLFTAIAGYLIGWTVTYTVIMRGDFRHFFKYLQLAWTQSGELPAFVNLGGLGVACIAPVGMWGYLRFRSK